MRFDIHIYFEDSNSNSSKLDSILSLVGQILNKENQVMIDITALTEKVNNAVTVENSVAALLGTVVQEIKDLSAQVANDPVVQQQLNDLASQLDTATTALSAAAANVPPAPTA